MEARAFDLHKRLKDKEAKHNTAMAEVLEDAAVNYGALEKEHFNTIHKMKEAEERARIESEHRAKMDVELNQLKEKVRKLETECNDVELT